MGQQKAEGSRQGRTLGNRSVPACMPPPTPPRMHPSGTSEPKQTAAAAARACRPRRAASMSAERMRETIARRASRSPAKSQFSVSGLPAWAQGQFVGVTQQSRGRGRRDLWPAGCGPTRLRCMQAQARPRPAPPPTAQPGRAPVPPPPSAQMLASANAASLRTWNGDSLSRRIRACVCCSTQQPRFSRARGREKAS